MKRFLVLLISAFLMSGLFTYDLQADVGPKPSVTVYVDEEIEGPYFVTLLSDREPYGPWGRISEKEASKDDPLKDQAYAFFSRYKDADGYFFLGNMSQEMTGAGSFSWNYYPPENFKIAIYDSGSETILVSDVYERTAFNSYFHVRIENGSLSVKEESHFGIDLLKAIGRSLATVAVELAVAYLFGYRKKKHIITILIVNLITQILLGVVMMLADHYGGLLAWMIFFPIAEIAVIVLEMVLYQILIRNEKRGKLILYAILANLLTAALTFAFTFYDWAGL